MARIPQKELAALFAIFATALTAALLFGLDPVLRPMLAPLAHDLIWIFAAALLGSIAVAEWRASRPRTQPPSLKPANDDRNRPKITDKAAYA